jgi:hypothetical protein
MPVRMLPPVEREWPHHLKPIGGDLTPQGIDRWRDSRGFDSGRRPLPWQERRRIYLERSGILLLSRRDEYDRMRSGRAGKRSAT